MQFANLLPLTEFLVLSNRRETVPLRVANVIEEGKLGGPQIRMVTVAAALKGSVSTVIVMPCTNSEAFREMCESLGVEYKLLRITRITKDWKIAIQYVLFSAFEIWALRTYFLQEKIDLVHVSGGSWQYKGAIAAKLAKKKVVWHINDTLMPDIIKFIFSKVSWLADSYIFASHRSQEYYKKLIPGKSPRYIIPAPVNNSVFSPSNSYAGDEGLIHSWSGKLVVGTVANISLIKGIELFIKTASRLNLTHDNLQFVIVGTIFRNQKPYFKKLLRLMKDLSVHNMDFVGERRDVRPIVSRFDLYVCSSIAESSPISVWEAMALGKPIVSTDVGDVPRYVIDGSNGFIVPNQDEEEMATKISELVLDASMRENYGHRSREISMKSLDLSQCAEKHIQAYTATSVQE